jgi:hypothetical protein
VSIHRFDRSSEPSVDSSREASGTRPPSESDRGRLWTAIREHVPNIYALIFGVVRVGTVSVGARLVRGLPEWVTVLLAIGVAGLTLEMERRLAKRLNEPLAPRQSLTGIVIGWLPPLAVVMTLNALTAFSVGSTMLAAAHTDTAFHQYWHEQKEHADAWLVAFRTAATKAAAETQAQVDAEQLRVAAARRDKTPYSTEDLARSRRRLADTRDAMKRASAVTSLSVEAPADRAQASVQIDRLFRSLTDVYIPALSLVAIAPPPSPGVFEPPAVDVLTLFVNETGGRTPRAVSAWISAFVLEILGFMSLYLGGRRTPLADRIRDWKSRLAAPWRALTEIDGASVSLSLLLLPSGRTASCVLRAPHDVTAAEAWPLIYRTLATFPDMAGCRLREMRAENGTRVSGDRPLCYQLGDGALVLVLEPIAPDAAAPAGERRGPARTATMVQEQA